MKTDNRLVAYIEFDNDEPYIDIVHISKKGTSFYYAGCWWARSSVLSDYCTNAEGEKLKINPLSHSYNPYKNFYGEIKVKEAAKERYTHWLQGQIKSE